jgi:hypothetical protein
MAFLILAEDMYETYCSRGQQICFSNPGIRVMERLVASGFADKVGREHFFACMHDAVQFCLNEMDCEAMSVHESVRDRDSGDTIDMEDVEDVEAPTSMSSLSNK